MILEQVATEELFIWDFVTYIECPGRESKKCWHTLLAADTMHFYFVILRYTCVRAVSHVRDLAAHTVDRIAGGVREGRRCGTFAEYSCGRRDGVNIGRGGRMSGDTISRGEYRETGCMGVRAVRTHVGSSGLDTGAIGPSTRTAHAEKAILVIRIPSPELRKCS